MASPPTCHMTPAPRAPGFRQESDVTSLDSVRLSSDSIMQFDDLSVRPKTKNDRPMNSWQTSCSPLAHISRQAVRSAKRMEAYRPTPVENIPGQIMDFPGVPGAVDTELHVPPPPYRRDQSFTSDHRAKLPSMQKVYKRSPPRRMRPNKQRKMTPMSPAHSGSASHGHSLKEVCIVIIITRPIPRGLPYHLYD